MAAPLINPELVAQIRMIETATGRSDVFSGFVRRLEENITVFRKTFAECLARGDTMGAGRAAHTLKGTCHQLGASAMGELFAEIERTAKAGDGEAARRAYDAGGELIAQSLEALKKA
jgi:HPt (histidine-containing phosphotransfer) domain-containing protein